MTDEAPQVRASADVDSWCLDGFCRFPWQRVGAVRLIHGEGGEHGALRNSRLPLPLC